jgi:hypothetical protein
MKRVPGWILAAFIFSLLFPAASTAQTEETLYLVAAKDSRVKAQRWIDFLSQYDLQVEHYFLSELDIVKDRDFVVITGGLEEAGVRDLLISVIGDSEVASLEKEEVGAMYVKEDVWKPEQKVLVFAGHDSDDAAAARSESRERWMELLRDWFGLEDVPGGLKPY